MAEPKTQPTDADVGEFLAAATPDRRRVDGLALAELFAEVTGVPPVMWGPTMVGYGTYDYVSPVNPRTRGTWYKTGFSPRKAQLVLYGLHETEAQRALLPSLGKHSTGVSCMYINKLDDVDLGVLRQLIELAWAGPDTNRTD